MVKQMNIPKYKASEQKVIALIIRIVITPYTSVRAGFPSPADEYKERSLDLNKALISTPSATVLVIAEGDSMRELGIFQGSTLVVDKSIKAAPGHIVIVKIDGQLVVKKLVAYSKNQLALISGDSKQPPIIIFQDSEISVWGVVVYAIHDLGRHHDNFFSS
jgi:DNA polymerase V